MYYLNKVMLIGRLGQNPEIRSLQSGSKVANFSLATQTSWKDKQTNEWVNKTHWHRLVAFGDNFIDNVIAKLQKGNLIYAEGALQSRDWTDNNGVKKYITEIIIDINGRITNLTGRTNDNDMNITNNNQANQDWDVNTDLDDEIPF